MLHKDHVSLIVPETEPFWLFWCNSVIFHPHPETEVLDICEASLVVGVLGVVLIVYILQEYILVVEPGEVPPSSIVISRGTEILDDSPLSQISKNMICKWTPPRPAFLVYSNSHMWWSKSEECVNLESLTLFNHRSCNKTSLWNTDDAHFLASKVWVIVDLMAHSCDLQRHHFKNWGDVSITDLDAFYDSLVLNCISGHFYPWVDLVAVTVQTVKD